MRFKARTVTLLLFVSALPLCGQDNSAPTSSADSYAQHLKALADSDKSNHEADSQDRDAYREHLRRLAQGEEDRVPSTQAPSAAKSLPVSDETHADAQIGVGSSTAKPTTNSEPAAQAVEANPPAQNVSLRPEMRSAEPVPPSAGQEAPASNNCTDPYCERLRQVANGATPSYVSPSDNGPTSTNERNFIKNIAFDQIHIWESPFKLRPSDATWAVPFGITTGALVVTDRDVSKQAATPGRYDTSLKLSDWGLYSFIGAGAGFYGMGLITDDQHRRETGLLSGEAFVNATLVAEALKFAFGRQRPFEGDGFGHIGKGGSSFPSEHAIGSWAIASVLAHEYPNPFMEFTAYGLASAVSLARITAGQHFPSDVFVGGTFGYLIGRKIYKDHHDRDLGGSEYGTFVHERRLDAEHSGSAYVPLDSWVYPVIDRLAALGIVHSNFDSERPFTRLECARLTAEAAENAYFSTSSDIQGMIDSLQTEFSRDSEVWAGGSTNRSVELESVYTRFTEIAGPVLRDGFNFGQTLYNDYGRPYGRGFNDITGFSGRATSGPLVFYFRGEYQHAPANPEYTSQQQALITSFNFGAAEPTNPFPSADRFQILDAYLGLNFSGNQLTIGQQSLWWGPGTGGPFLWSNNAQPLKMARLTNTSPVSLPLLSSFLGPFHYDTFFGQMDDYQHMFVNGQLFGPQLSKQPLVMGQRFSFKPTQNFEFGFTRTSIFGGVGFPLTSSYLFRALFSTNDPLPGNPRKPGYEQSDLDVTYRIPGLRNLVTLYWDEYSKDEISPLFFPRRSAQRPGIYFAKLPKMNKIDLRVEGVYTDPPGFGVREGPAFFYTDITYGDGYREDGNLLGSWIGRNGRGVYATSRWWLSPKDNVQFGYREATVDPSFLEGGRYQDFSITGNMQLSPAVAFSAFVQRENWRFPVLAATMQTNLTSSVQFTYSPQWSKK